MLLLHMTETVTVFITHKASSWCGNLLLSQLMPPAINRSNACTASQPNDLILFPDYRFLQYPPSMVAAGSVCVARTYMKLLPVWTMRLEEVSGYTRQLINPVVELFLEQSR